MYMVILSTITVAIVSALLFVKYLRPKRHVIENDERRIPPAYPRFYIYNVVHTPRAILTDIQSLETKGPESDGDSMGKFFTLSEHDMDHIFWGEVTLNIGTRHKSVTGVVRSYTKNNYICLLCNWSEHLNIVLKDGDTLNGMIKDLCIGSKNTGWKSTIERSIILYLFMKWPISSQMILQYPDRDQYMWFKGIAEMSGYVFNTSGEFTFPMVYYAKKKNVHDRYPVLVGMEIRIPLTTFICFFQTRNLLMNYEGYYSGDRESESTANSPLTNNPYTYSSDDDQMQVYYD